VEAQKVSIIPKNIKLPHRQVKGNLSW